MAPLVIAGLIEFANKIFDKVIPDKAAAEKAKSDFLAVAQTNEFALMLKQIEVNIAEASNPSIFVSGWRPFVGWVCGFALAYTYILLPFMQFGVYALGSSETIKQFARLPKLDLSDLLPILLGMLGLGIMRTYEKIKDKD